MKKLSLLLIAAFTLFGCKSDKGSSSEETPQEETTLETLEFMNMAGFYEADINRVTNYQGETQSENFAIIFSVNHGPGPVTDFFGVAAGAFEDHIRIDISQTHCAEETCSDQLQVIYEGTADLEGAYIKVSFYVFYSGGGSDSLIQEWTFANIRTKASNTLETDSSALNTDTDFIEGFFTPHFEQAIMDFRLDT